MMNLSVVLTRCIHRNQPELALRYSLRCTHRGLFGRKSELVARIQARCELGDGCDSECLGEGLGFHSLLLRMFLTPPLSTELRTLLAIHRSLLKPAKISQLWFLYKLIRSKPQLMLHCV